MPVIILGGIYSGVFTPTEAAVIAVFYGLIVGVFVYKEIKLSDIPRILTDSAITMSTVLLIMSASTILMQMDKWLAYSAALAKEKFPKANISSFYWSMYYCCSLECSARQELLW